MACIRCRTVPVGDHGPLIPRLDAEVNALALSIFHFRGWPKGLNLDGLIIFDMQADGGVDNIEILAPLADGLVSGTVHPRSGDRYWRLILEPSDSARIERDTEVKVCWSPDFTTFRFAGEPIDARYLIGPDIEALLGEGELRGLKIGLQGFRKHAP